jgi:hypothetical protein
VDISVHQAARISGRYLGQQKLAQRIEANEHRPRTTAQDRVEISDEARRLLALRPDSAASGAGGSGIARNPG